MLPKLPEIDYSAAVPAAPAAGKSKVIDMKNIRSIQEKNLPEPRRLLSGEDLEKRYRELIRAARGAGEDADS